MVLQKGAHFKDGEAYFYSPTDAVSNHIRGIKYKMWLHANKKAIRRYGEYTVREAQKNGITPFEQYYGGGEVKTMIK